MKRILVLTLFLGACAGTPHRHIVGEGVTCPHRSHATAAVVPVPEHVASERQRFEDGVSSYPDQRAGAAIYEGDIDFTVRPAQAPE